jgi:hypoxanthine phosphoribosyltransferase
MLIAIVVVVVSLMRGGVMAACALSRRQYLISSIHFSHLRTVDSTVLSSITVKIKTPSKLRGSRVITKKYG